MARRHRGQRCRTIKPAVGVPSVHRFFSFLLLTELAPCEQMHPVEFGAAKNWGAGMSSMSLAIADGAICSDRLEREGWVSPHLRPAMARPLARERRRSGSCWLARRLLSALAAKDTLEAKRKGCCLGFRRCPAGPPRSVPATKRHNRLKKVLRFLHSFAAIHFSAPPFSSWIKPDQTKSSPIRMNPTKSVQ